MSDIKLSSFPDDKFSALAMLYLQSHDFSNLSPSELATKYDEVYEEIKNHYSEVSEARKALRSSSLK